MATRNNTFILKRSNVVNKIPVLSGLTLGELALNTADSKLYSLYTGGLTGATEVREIGWDRLSISGGTLYGQTYYSFGTGWTQNQTVSYISASTGNVLVTKEWVESLAFDDSTSLAANVATKTVLPTCTYNNGTGGVGATLTRTSNGTTGNIDGITVGLADIILVKNQASQLQNGVYEVTVVGDVSTQFVLTRTTYSDETSEFDPQIVIPTRGTQAGLRFAQTTADPVIGVSNIVYTSVGNTTTFVTQSSTGTQTSGNIPFWTTTARDLSKGSNTQLFWDNTNKRLGVNNSTPTATIHLKGVDSSSSNYGLKVQNSGTTNNLTVRNDGVIEGDGLSGNSFQLGSYNPYIEGDLTVGRAERDTNTKFSIFGANYPSLYFDSVYSTKVSLTSGAGGQYLFLSDNVNPKITWLSSTNIGINLPNTASTINAELEVNGKTKTETLQVTSGATAGYVLSSDSNGNAIWSSPSSLTGLSTTDYYVTGGTYSNGTLTLERQNGSVVVTGITNNNGGGGGSSGSLFYFNLSVPQSPYREISETPVTAIEQTSGMTIGAGLTSTIASFLTPSGSPNITNIPAGIWSFFLHSYKQNNNASFNIFCEVYVRTTGGTETLLISSDPEPITSNSPNPSMQVSDVFYSGTSLNSSDRILVKVRSTNTSNQSHNVTFVTEGTSHYSYLKTSFGGLSTITLQQAYNNSTSPEITTNVTLGGVQFRGGTGSDTDKNIIIENNASSETAYITADGGGVFNSLSATTYYNLPTTISPAVNLFNYYNFI